MPEDKYKINSYESLTQALSDTTSGVIQFIAQEKGELKLRLYTVGLWTALDRFACMLHCSFLRQQSY